MSIEALNHEQQLEQNATCRVIDLILYPKQHDLGGFSVRRALPSRHQRMVGPWIFFDHMGPAKFSRGDGIDVRPHPHINLATVTYLFEGEMLHRDSLGNEIAIVPGEINLMVAGKGIVHSERQRDEIKAGDNNALEGLQLWLALPEADEEMEPEFHHYAQDEMPSLMIESVPVRVLIGSAYGVQSPVKTFAQTLYIEASLQSGQSLTLPDTVIERALYICKGKLKVEQSIIEAHSMGILGHRQNVTVEAVEDTRLVVIGGEPLSQRHIWWNFVSSRKPRIEQAKRDWQADVFPKIPGDEIEFIPLPEN